MIDFLYTMNYRTQMALLLLLALLSMGLLVEVSVEAFGSHSLKFWVICSIALGVSASFAFLYITSFNKRGYDLFVSCVRRFAEGDISARVDLNAFSEPLKADFFEAAAAFNAFADDMQNRKERVSSIASRLVFASTKLFEIAKRLEINIVNQDGAIKNMDVQMSGIALTSSSFSNLLEKVNQSILRTSTLAKEGAKTLDEMKAIAEQLRQASTTILESLSTMRFQVDKMNEVLESIISIVDESNLLSLNTAISASRLGVEGKGFIVVADQVKQLAADTSLMTLDMEATVKEIVALMKQAVADFDLFSNKVHKLLQDEMNVSNQLKWRIERSYSQLEAFNGINQEMKMVTEKTAHVSRLLDDLSNATVETDQLVRRLYRDAETLYRSVTS
jgi:methyl-accepting chemotaxis protein